MEHRLESVATSQQQKKRTYSSRNRLRRDRVRGHPVLELFVSGASTGSEKHFFCTICHKDVSMETRDAGELVRHFSGPRHWQADVTYRVHQGLPVFNKLMDPLELSESQRSDFLSRTFKDKSEGYSFPEDLLPSCTRVDSVVPLLTMVNCLVELLRAGGTYVFLRRLWGCFRATLGPDNPLYSLNWSKSESLVLFFFSFLFLFLWLPENVVSGFLCMYIGVEYWFFYCC